MLNFILLVACIGIVIALVLYLFYWNRFIAYIIGVVLRLVYWNNDSGSQWVDIGSIHFSLLAGRIIIKDLKYYTSNETLKVVKGQITWRYWVRKPTTEEDVSQTRVGSDARAHPCRIHVSLQGVEYFIYNRTSLYDSFIHLEDKHNDPNHQKRGEHDPLQASHSPDPQLDSKSSLRPPYLIRYIRAPIVILRLISWFKRQLPSVSRTDFFPVGIELVKGALIYGNPSTHNLLAIEFQRAEGTYGVVQTRSKHDLCKQVLGLKIQHVLARYVRNDDYKCLMATTGAEVEDLITTIPPSLEQPTFTSFQAFAKLWRRFGNLSLKNHDHSALHSNDAPQRSQKTDQAPVDTDIASLEYAVEPKLLEAPMLDLSYYVDIVGDVPQTSQTSSTLEPFDIGNGDVSPEWGVEVVIWGGILRYGPWADRQRAELHRSFFPPPYRDVRPHGHLNPGDKRVWTSFKTFIELRDDTTLYIPFREASKNWQWDGKADIPPARKREPVSIHITAGDRSSISHTMDMVAGARGYEPVLEVHLNTVSVTSSLNDIRLLTAESCRLHCDLPSPLKWNNERTWTFAVSLQRPVLYLIRDHINMCIDLGKDWTSGPPIDHALFVPTLYVFQLEMHHFRFNLYANDHNIIDKPLVEDENALLTFLGARLSHEARIPANIFRPESTTIPFFVDAPNLSFNLSLPRWNTHALHAPRQGNNLGKAPFFRLDASYHYFAEVREEYIDRLSLNLTTRDIALKALGWSIRYFMVLRENYFGSFTHFSTLNEYLDKRRRGLPVGDPIMQKYRPNRSNVFHLELGVSLTNALVVAPAGLPGYETSDDSRADDNIGPCVMMTFPELQVHLRLHDYYMEMSFNIDSLSGCIGGDCPEKVDTMCMDPKAKEAFLIDGIDITANRLFGPQPRTATFVCVWTIHFGRIKSLLSALDGDILRAAGNAFRLNFVDLSNAPAADYILPLDPDVTFVNVSLEALDVTWLAGQAALEISVPQGLRYETNDIGGKSHRKLASLRLPHLSMKIYLTAASRRQTWLEAAEFTTDTYLDVYYSPPGWVEKARAQAEFVHTQSEPTGRSMHMFEAFNTDDALPHRILHKNGLYLPQPRSSNHLGQRALHLRTRRHGGGTELPAIKPRRGSVLSHLTESEGEELLETDRDGRLATIRSITPALLSPTDDENESMSSGDESDDEDLTDADSSGSEWSEFMNDASENPNLSFLTTYDRLTRHYSAPLLKTPSLWEGSPFHLTRDLGPLAPTLRHPITGSLREKRLTNCGSTKPPSVVFRFECRQGLDVRVLPLVLPAVSHLVEAIEAKVLSPEREIDNILSSYLYSFNTMTESTRLIKFDVVVSSARICILHQIPALMNESQSLMPAIKDLNPDLRGVMMTVNILFDGWHLIGASLDRESTACLKWTLFTSLDSLSASLDTPSDNSSARRGTRNVVRADVRLFQSKYEPGNLEMTCETISTELDHICPDLIMTANVALAESTRQLFHVYKTFTHHAMTKRQNMVYNVITSSKSKAIVDPLSTIQPSYLVQSGLPHRLRTDATFRFLFHLRNCLWHMKGPERGAWSESKKLDVETAVEDAVKMMSLSLDADASSVADAAILNILFPNWRARSVQQQPENANVLFKLLSIRIEKASVLLRDPLSASFSEFGLTSLNIMSRKRQSGSIHSLTQSQLMHSRTSLRDQRQAIPWLSASVAAGDITLAVSPHLMRFAQQVLRVHRHHAHLTSLNRNGQSVRGRSSSNTATEPTGIDLTSSFRCLRIQAAAENLTFEFGANSMRFASSFVLGSGFMSLNHLTSANLSTLFDKFYLRAVSPRDAARQSGHDTLACLACSGGKANYTLRQDLSSATPQIVLSMESVLLSVPRSALRLYHFIQEWRADFLPGIEATLKELLSEIQKSPIKGGDSAPQPIPKLPNVQIHGAIARFGVSLQIMHGTWFSWDVYRIFAYLDPSSSPSRDLLRDFGLQLESQSFSISSGSLPLIDATRSMRIKLDLPTLSITGYYDGSRIQTIALVEFIHFKVKPSHWDTLLVVQQKFGQDFHDLMTLVDETRRHQRSAVSIKKSSPSLTRQPWKFGGSLKMRGFRIGLEGLSSTLYLECTDIRGEIDPDANRIWQVRFSDLGLSLASYPAIRDPFSNRSHRSAFVIIDFQTSGRSRKSNIQVLEVLVTKIHAIMQPSSIGEVGDFLDHMQAEILKRKEQRAIELAGFREKTRSVIRTFEINIKDTDFKESSSPLSKYTLKFSIRNIGVAFPLTLDQDFRLPQRSRSDSSEVRAFLFSIKSLDFGSHRGESGQATMHQLSFQFVSRFRQSIEADFSGTNHRTRNRLVYPEMTAYVRSHRSASFRQVRIEANVSGFGLDIAPTITDYIFSLIDVYHQGKDRVARLTTRRPSAVDSTPRFQAANIEKADTMLPDLNVIASLTFLSGKVRMFSSAASVISTQSNFHEPLDEQLSDAGGEIFELPIISLWGEYHATSTPPKFGASGEAEPSILMFKSTVHSSQNLLRPTLLPILTELVSKIDTRMREGSVRHASPRTTAVLPATPDENNQVESMSVMQINLSLRIDQSKLELTCQPDVNVIAGLHWDSGGFVANIYPGARQVTISGSVGGLTMGLKHGFLSEDCLRLDARNLAFSVTFGKLEMDDGNTARSISVVMDTELSGGVRFSRLQDVLCFKAVWLDRIPVFAGQDGVAAKPSPELIIQPSPTLPDPKFSTAFLIRIRQIRLDIDLGQSISAATLELKDALLRTKATAGFNEVSLSVADVLVVAKGNVSGSANFPDFVFQTIRRTDRPTTASSRQPTLLELTMTSGALNAMLESEHQKLIQYRAEPLKVEIFDDWSMISSEAQIDDRPLRLSFVVSGSEIVAVATIRTLPKLLFYIRKFKANLEAQREGASRESKAFRTTHSPKPDNPLSAVANALLHSARTRLKEAEAGLCYVIRQQMSLRLSELRLAVFPRTMADLEIAQFVGRDVHARLDRLVETDRRTTQRTLHLSFSSMVISRYNQLNHTGAVAPLESDGKVWLTLLLKDAVEAIIVGLPHTQMRMESEQTVEDLKQTLAYDFHSRFVRHEGTKDLEDIYITLNMSLYSWLTLLRKNFSREMNQVKASADWRSAINVGSAPRKRVPDPILLTGDEVSPASTYFSNPPSSAFLSPRTIVRTHSMEQSKSASAAYSSFSASGDDLYLQPTHHSKSTDTLLSPFAMSSAIDGVEMSPPSPATDAGQKSRTSGIVYNPRNRKIERLTMRQLGEATPDVMHPFFMKKAGFNLEDSLPQYVHEYATLPLEEIMEALLKLYSNQLQKVTSQGQSR